MYARTQFPPPRVPSQQSQMMVIQPSTIGNLLAVFQKQSLSNRITVPEMYIGDEGALELASFLRGAPNISMLDLKGNNITSRGFVEIFASLRQNFQIKSLNLEWNRLGGTDLSGVEALYNLMCSNRSITHLDLRNNKLNQTTTHIIANFIRNNSTLASLDLRWNEIGNNGARAILTGLQENSSLVGIELAGNGISEELNSQIQELIGNNRDGVPHAAMRREERSRRNSFNAAQDLNDSLNNREGPAFNASMGGSNQHQMMRTPLHPATTNAHIIHEGMRSSRGRFLDQAEVQRNVYSGLESLNIISHLEIQIENERVHGLHFKEDLNRRIQEMRDGLNVKTQKKAALEEELLAISHENGLLRSDFTRIDQDFKNFQHEKQKALRSTEEKSHMQEELIRETDKRLQSELLSLSDQNIHEMRQIDRDWNIACEDQLKKINLGAKKNDELRVEIYRVMDAMVKSEFQSKDDAKEVVENLKEAAQSDYEVRFATLEKRMNEQTEIILESDRRTKESVRMHTTRLKQLSEQRNDTLIGTTRLAIENEDITLHNGDFEKFIERQSKEYASKDELIEKLKQELNKLKVKDQETEATEKELKRSVEDAFLKEHDEYNALHDEYRDRIQELEKTLRDSNSENLRLRADFQRLSDLLTANLQKTTYQSFIEQKVM